MQTKTQKPHHGADRHGRMRGALAIAAFTVVASAAALANAADFRIVAREADAIVDNGTVLDPDTGQSLTGRLFSDQFNNVHINAHGTVGFRFSFGISEGVYGEEALAVVDSDGTVRIVAMADTTPDALDGDFTIASPRNARLNDRGEMIFTVGLHPPVPQGVSTDSAVLLYNGTTLERLTQTGQVVTGTGLQDELRLQSRRTLDGTAPILNDRGESSFQIKPDGASFNSLIGKTDTGFSEIFVPFTNTDDGALSVVAFSSHVMNDQGAVAWAGNSNVNNANPPRSETGLFYLDDDGLTTIAREGGLAIERTPAAFNLHFCEIQSLGPQHGDPLPSAPMINDQGYVAFNAPLKTPTGGSEGFGLFVGNKDGVIAVAYTGGDAPGTDNGFGTPLTFTNLQPGTRVILGADDQVAFAASLSNGRQAIFTGSPGSLSLIAETGALAPGLSGAGLDGRDILLDSFDDPFINSAGEVVIGAYLRDPAWGAPRYGYFRYVPGEGLTKIISEFDTVLGQDVLALNNWTEFADLRRGASPLSDNGDFVFIANLRETGNTSADFIRHVMVAEGSTSSTNPAVPAPAGAGLVLAALTLLHLHRRA